MNASTAVLTVKDVFAGYGSRGVLYGVSANVERGEIVAILGLNGSGKSTLLRVMGGLIRPTSGRVYLQGVDITEVPAHRRRTIGVAHFLQGGQVFSSLTGKENLQLAGVQFAPGNEDARTTLWSRARRLLSLIPWPNHRATPLPSLQLSLSNLGNAHLQRNLHHYGNCRLRAGLLSGGQRHELALLMTLASNPKVLLLDEPMSGLAPDRVENVQDGLRRLAKDENVAIVLVEQRQSLARGLADRCLWLSEGKVTESNGNRESDESCVQAHPMIHGCAKGNT